MRLLIDSTNCFFKRGFQFKKVKRELQYNHPFLFPDVDIQRSFIFETVKRAYKARHILKITVICIEELYTNINKAKWKSCSKACNFFQPGAQMNKARIGTTDAWVAA